MTRSDTPGRAAEGEDRPLGTALLRGWRRKCPSCGGGRMMQGYLTVRPACPACGEVLSHHRADDLPAWGTILIVGHLVGAAMLSVDSALDPPVWVHWAVWPAAVLGLSLWMLPRLKGSVVGMQWAWRMHGFDGG